MNFDEDMTSYSVSTMPADGIALLRAEIPTEKAVTNTRPRGFNTKP